MRNEPSKQITGKFKANDIKYELDVKGRGTSVLGSKQGDHVTAYALIEHGIKRAVEGITIDEDGTITDPRDQRSQLYNFLSAVAVVNEKQDERNMLYTQVGTILNSYNDKRFKKTEISIMRKELKDEKKKLDSMNTQLKALNESIMPCSHKDSLLAISHQLSEDLNAQTNLYKTRLENFRNDQEQKLKINHYLICTALSDIAEAILTFYNHIPLTSFLKIEGFASDRNEGTNVRTAIKNLRRVENNLISSSTKKDPSPDKEDISAISNSLCALFHYPNISNDTVLEKHQKATKALPSLRAQPRTNKQNQLELVITRHLHIAFAAFPVVGEHYKNQVVYDFTKMIARDWDYDKHKTKNLEKNVIKGLDKLISDMNKNHFTSTASHNDNCSSEAYVHSK